ncbi:unnamed protein product [Phaedon cochleariae]|uniref:Large ribosomal subunit protein uL22 n=1 Tax=Phaedon cochleariae TaxID=80249 RepID=A0A9P0GPN6_PHACE|nr:unnamed protein product [Phaedon cochleariae]
MVKHSGTHRYSMKELEKGGEFLVKAKASNVPVKFKNLVEVSNAIRNMTTTRAYAYLLNVLAKKECIPARKFKSGIGRCAQAKQFQTVIGRWPRNAVKCMIDLLKNASANCEFLGKDPVDYYVHHVQASQAPTSTRRTYRAHGRINPYMRHNCHLQVILKQKGQ